MQNNISFARLKTRIVFNEKDPSGSVLSATIDAGSIASDSQDKTKSAKSELEVQKFPEIIFTAASIKKISAGEYEAEGNLTLKGVTKKIKLPFHFDSQNDTKTFPFVFKETFKANLLITPLDFNIKHFKPNETLLIEIVVPVKR